METFSGHIKTTKDALLLFEACRLGELKRVKRRLCSRERSKIKSGSVFAFDEGEAGMCRWTDGRTWSPSRVLGSFLTYRELDTKRRPRRDGKDNCSYKPNGLIKQSFSICTSSNQKMHLISYYTKADIAAGHLRTPSEDPAFAHITIPKGVYPELNPLDTSGGHSATLHLLMSASAAAGASSSSPASSPSHSEHARAYRAHSPPPMPVQHQPYPSNNAYPAQNASNGFHRHHPPSLSSSPVSVCSDDDIFSPHSASTSSTGNSSHTYAHHAPPMATPPSPHHAPQTLLPPMSHFKTPATSSTLYILQPEDNRQLEALKTQLRI